MHDIDPGAIDETPLMIDMWKRSTIYRDGSMYWILSLASCATNAVMIDADYAWWWRFPVCLIFGVSLVRSLSISYRLWRLGLRSVKICRQIDTIGKHYEVAIAAQDDWRAEIARRQHNELVDEHRDLMKQVFDEDTQ